jgi:hypothetical protein
MGAQRNDTVYIRGGIVLLVVLSRTRCTYSFAAPASMSRSTGRERVDGVGTPHDTVRPSGCAGWLPAARGAGSRRVRSGAPRGPRPARETRRISPKLPSVQGSRSCTRYMVRYKALGGTLSFTAVTANTSFFYKSCSCDVCIYSFFIFGPRSPRRDERTFVSRRGGCFWLVLVYGIVTTDIKGTPGAYILVSFASPSLLGAGPQSRSRLTLSYSIRIVRVFSKDVKAPALASRSLTRRPTR